MSRNIIEYRFSETNRKTVIFVPGYSGGLEVAVIKKLVNHYLQEGISNVFGITLDYENDTPDLFDLSQDILTLSVKEIVAKSSGNNVVLFAKSLGGSLSLFKQHELPVTKIVILGCSIVLGWPQRISILKSKEPILPDYKNEWNGVLKKINTPTLILNGASDNLTDNKFLLEIANLNEHIRVGIIEYANHSLENSETGTVSLDLLLNHVKSFDQ